MNGLLIALCITYSVYKNMKHKSMAVLCIALSLSCLMMTGCDKRTTVEKANELVQKSGLKIAYFEQLDSVMGYQQAHSCRMAAYNLQNSIEATLWKQRSEKRILTEYERKECLEEADEAEKLEIQAAKIELEAHLKGTPKEFIGYASPVIADSVSNDTLYTIYFDEDVTKILSVKKKALGL